MILRGLLIVATPYAHPETLEKKWCKINNENASSEILFFWRRGKSLFSIICEAARKMRVFASVCVCVCEWICKCMCVHLCVCVCKRKMCEATTKMRVCERVCVCVCVCEYVCVCVCEFVCACMLVENVRGNNKNAFSARIFWHVLAPTWRQEANYNTHIRKHFGKKWYYIKHWH